MRELKLTQNKVALIDDEDYLPVILESLKWQAKLIDNLRWYCGYTNRNKDCILLHRFIMNPLSNEKIDHINGNGLDNRKENLRICTNQENIFNSKLRSNNTSGYKGVSFDKRNGLWHSYIKHNYKRKHLGYFNNKIDAALAYNEKAKQLFGEFANLNKID